MKKFMVLLLMAALASGKIFAQVVTASPVFPSANGPVTIIFDATEGNGALANYTGDVFIHTGVITDASTSPSDWKHVVTVWGSTDPDFKMTALGNNKYSFYISNITDYYGVTSSETVLQLAMVFRNGDGSIVGRDADNSDIYYDVWDGVTLEGIFLAPGASTNFVNLGDNIPLVYVTSSNCTLSLYENNNLVTQISNTDSLSYSLTAATTDAVTVKVIADDGSTQVVDSFQYVVKPPVSVASLPAGADDGINYVNDSTVTLVLVAPHKQFVYAIGDFSNWIIDNQLYMNLTPDSTRWWVNIEHLTPSKEYTYQYLVDGNLYIADPYCDKILDPSNDPYIPPDTYPYLIAYPTGKTSGNVSVLQTAQIPFDWQTTSYVRPDPDNMVIYELLLRDFLAAHDYQTLIDTLPYLKNLGINAIELMPVSEFEGNISWGYNPSFYFAPDKYYGTKYALKTFIDVCHQNGIAVIQDIVLNHSCGQSPLVQLYFDGATGGPAADNPWYNPDQDPNTAGYQGPHPFGVCYDINHESPYTQKLVDDILRYWDTEYKMDGWRFDLSKGFTNVNYGTDVTAWGHYDQSRVDILDRMAGQIRTVDPNVILILEHFADTKEEDTLSNHGFYLWSNSNNNYAQSAMGFASSADIGWISYKTHGFLQPHAVGYMESHDEERITYKVQKFGNHNATYDVRSLDSSLSRMKQAACFFIPVPGPKMIWQFGELGYEFSINTCPDLTLNSACRTDPKPIKWDYLDYGPRTWVYNFYKALIDLKHTYPVFQTTDYLMAVSSLKKNIRLNDASMNVDIVGNFDITAGNQAPSFQHTGWWFEYFTGDSLNVTDINAQLFLEPGEYRFYTDVKLPAADLGNVGINDPVQAASLALYQNVPNPFNEITTIDFYVPRTGNAKLEIFDAFGRLVKTIAEKSFAKGYYTVDLAASDLPAGMYICKLSQQGDAKSIKMQVIR